MRLRIRPANIRSFDISMRSLFPRFFGWMLPLLLGGWPAMQASAQDVGPMLAEIQDLANGALEAARRAAEAPDVETAKAHADRVFEAVWGVPSGLAEEGAEGAAPMHGWMTRWQVAFGDFDRDFAVRYDRETPAIDDPSLLGIMGRGRHVRSILEDAMRSSSADPAIVTHGPHVVHSLNNVIGWMRIDDGVTKGERQPRVDLTYEWDAPIEFWMSSADTGWLHEAFAQALNILKTDYEGDADMARSHAADLVDLLEKSLRGVDADGDGAIEPVRMEGGLLTALQHAGFAGVAAD